jgi:hypothetical protein
MANEEIRGEQQDPNLIGISGPGSTLGLGGQGGSVPGMGGISPIAPPYIGGAQKVFDTLPIRGRKFTYDFYVFLANPTDTTALAGGIASIPLLGPNAPYLDLEFALAGTMAAGGFGGRRPQGGYITLIRKFSAQLFFSTTGSGFLPVPAYAFSGSTLQTNALQLSLSGGVLTECQFNSVGVDRADVFIAMNQTDTLTAQWGITFGELGLGALPALYLQAHIVIEGELLPDNGQPKDIQVSL